MNDIKIDQFVKIFDYNVPEFFGHPAVAVVVRVGSDSFTVRLLRSSKFGDRIAPFSFRYPARMVDVVDDPEEEAIYILTRLGE